MKRFGLLYVLSLTIILIGSAYAATDITAAAKRLPADIFKEISVIPPKPHFVLGLEQKTDGWERYLEKRKVFQTKDLFYGQNGTTIIDKSRADYVVKGNSELFETINVEGKDLRIIYTHHHFTSDGMYVFWSKMGEKNLAEFSPLYEKYRAQWGSSGISDEQWKNIQQVLGSVQFEAVKEFVHNAIKRGLAKNIKDYGEINLTEGVIEFRSKLLDDPKYRDRLDDPITNNPNLKIRDILPIPFTRAEDFLPDLIIVGPKGFYGGFANLKTIGTERIVFLDLLGLALAYIGDDYALVAHEFVHTNPYLQGLPLSFYYDVEMWADITTGLDSDDITEFLFHPYQAVVRDVVKNTFGYDSDEVKRRIWRSQGLPGIRDVREQEFRAHLAEIKQIKDELVKFIKDPNNGFIVQFYRDPYYWITVNTKFCDTAAAFRILFALRYEPAGIFDPDKKDKDGKIIPPVIQTKEWLMKEEEAGRIKRLAEKAMGKTGQKTKLGEEMSKAEDMAGMIKCPVNSRDFLMSKEQQQKFREVVEPLIERAKSGDIESRVLLMRIFGGSGALIRMPVH